jgi:RNA polymerase sigma factor (sigma-70 family)
MTPSSPSHSALLGAFSQHYAELVRYLARRTGNVDEARALAHDTWLRIAERTPEKDIALADPRAYLFTISHNLVMNHLRRGHWMQMHLAECAQIDALSPAQAPDVADSAMYRQAVAVVEAALAALPARAREVYLAHGLHEEKQIDIAQRLDVSIDTVKRDIALATRGIEDALHTWRQTPAKHGGPARGATQARSRRKSLTALLGIFTVGLGSTAIWQLLQREALRYQTTLATLRGRMLQRSLPDGSELTLDALSRIDVDFSADVRALRLHAGAAFFAVQRDAARPFVVQALGAKVTVLGTRFGVEIDGGRNIAVQVESGLVRVEAHGQTTELSAGQSLRVEPDNVVRTQVTSPASWRTGELDFDNVPLGQALARVERYSPAPLHATPAAAGLPISGTVRVAQARSWIASLPNVLPVRVIRHADGSTEIDRR